MSDCRVYWGSHGCSLERGHKVKDGTEHVCDPPEWDEEYQTMVSCPDFAESWSAFGEDVTPEEVAAANKRFVVGQARARLRASGATYIHETTGLTTGNGRRPESIEEFERQVQLRRQFAMDNGENEEIAS